MRRPPHLCRTAILLGAAMLVAAGRPAPAHAGPVHRPGQPCRSEHTHPVRIEPDPAGGMEAVFALAGGSTQGSVALPGPLAADLVAHPDAYVSDVQLGSYEPVGSGDRAEALVCRIDATYHLDCPLTGTLDELCVEWDEGSRPRSRPIG